MGGVGDGFELFVAESLSGVDGVGVAVVGDFDGLSTVGDVFNVLEEFFEGPFGFEGEGFDLIDEFFGEAGELFDEFDEEVLGGDGVVEGAVGFVVLEFEDGGDDFEAV